MHLAREITTIAATLASGIIFPLYIYPNDDCSAWTPIVDAVSSHPSLPFYFIINVDSGPGVADQPDSSYQACIPSLKANNTRVFGYVHTEHGGSPPTDVERNITLYGGWEEAYRPEGIFFDEASAENDTEIISQLQGYADFARSVFADFIILNPGVPPQSDQYFTFADLIITAENFYSEFNVSSLQVSPSEPADKQAVVLHDAPESDAPYTSLLTELIDVDAGGLGIAAVFITEAEYTNVSVNWDAFVDAVETAAS